MFGHPVLPRPPRGAIPVAGPYRVGEDDWMLERAVVDFRRRGGSFVLAREKAAKRFHSFVGVTLFRVRTVARR